MEPLPVPLRRFAIVRFDLFHIEGVMLGVFLDWYFTKKVVEGLRRLAKDPSTFAYATRARYCIYELIENDDEYRPRIRIDGTGESVR